MPDGLFQTVPAINGVMDWAKIVNLETDADINNALFGNLAYIMHPSLVGKAKTKVKDASVKVRFLAIRVKVLLTDIKRFAPITCLKACRPLKMNSALFW